MIRPVPKTSAGYGYPAWVPDEYLREHEIRALGSRVFGSAWCVKCGRTGRLEKAHIVRKGMGGRQKDTDGPQVRLCLECHDDLDEHYDRAVAIRRDTGEVVFLRLEGETVVGMRTGVYV